MNKGIRNCFMGAAIAANTLTFANGVMVAHEYIHDDIAGNSWTSDGDKLLMTFANATVGSFAALGYPAMDWQSGAEFGYVSDGDSPVSYVADHTPDILQIPVGATVSILGAPSGAAGNFVGSITGYFAP